MQAALFGYFSSTLDAVILDAKAQGKYDDGIVALKGMSSVKLTHQEVIHKDAASGTPTPSTPPPVGSRPHPCPVCRRPCPCCVPPGGLQGLAAHFARTGNSFRVVSALTGPLCTLHMHKWGYALTRLL